MPCYPIQSTHKELCDRWKEKTVFVIDSMQDTPGEGVREEVRVGGATWQFAASMACHSHQGVCGRSGYCQAHGGKSCLGKAAESGTESHSYI